MTFSEYSAMLDDENNCDPMVEALRAVNRADALIGGAKPLRTMGPLGPCMKPVLLGPHSSVASHALAVVRGMILVAMTGKSTVDCRKFMSAALDKAEEFDIERAMADDLEGLRGAKKQ